MKLLSVVVGFLMIASTVFVPGKDCSDCGSKSAPPAKAKSSKAYPLATCLVSGKPLEKSKLTYDYRGQQFRFCSRKCRTVFTRNPAAYMAKLEEKKSDDVVEK